MFADLQAFGQSFLQPDISIFKQNLECLQNLHSKRKLFNKVSSPQPSHTCHFSANHYANHPKIRDTEMLRK